MGKKKSVIERYRKQNGMCTEKIIEFGNKTRWEKTIVRKRRNYDRETKITVQEKRRKWNRGRGVVMCKTRK